MILRLIKLCLDGFHEVLEDLLLAHIVPLGWPLELDNEQWIAMISGMADKEGLATWLSSYF